MHFNFNFILLFGNSNQTAKSLYDDVRRALISSRHDILVAFKRICEITTQQIDLQHWGDLWGQYVEKILLRNRNICSSVQDTLHYTLLVSCCSHWKVIDLNSTLLRIYTFLWLGGTTIRTAKAYIDIITYLLLDMGGHHHLSRSDRQVLTTQLSTCFHVVNVPNIALLSGMVALVFRR